MGFYILLPNYEHSTPSCIFCYMINRRISKTDCKSSIKKIFKKGEEEETIFEIYSKLKHLTITEAALDFMAVNWKLQLCTFWDLKVKGEVQ